MKRRILALAYLTLFSSAAFANASGSGARGGGNEVGAEFSAAALQAFQDISETGPPIISAADIAQLRSLLDRLEVISTDENLFVDVGGSSQKVVAVNFPETLQIQISAPYWDLIQDEEVRESIALHELESLLGVESTGRYKVSSALLEYLIEHDQNAKVNFDCEYDNGDHFVQIEISANSQEQAREIVLTHQPVQFEAVNPISCDPIIVSSGQRQQSSKLRRK